MSSPWEFSFRDFSALTRPATAADIANAKLKEWIASAPVVFKYEGTMPLRYQGATQTYDCWTDAPEAADTTCARLICIEPIVRDTAESLLRELMDRPGYSLGSRDLDQRARKLLDKK